MSKAIKNPFKVGDRVSYRRSGGSWGTYTVSRIDGDNVYDGDGTYLPFWELVLVK